MRWFYGFFVLFGLLTTFIPNAVTVEVEDNVLDYDTCVVMEPRDIELEKAVMSVISVGKEVHVAPAKPVEKPAVKNPVAKLAPIKSTVRNDYGFTIKDMGENELRGFMEDRGYVGLNKMNMHELRRLYLAYEYDKLYWDVHKETGFPVSMVFAWFIYEATLKGVESDLWMEHWNPGGIKYRGRSNKFVYKYDDCGGKPCKFESMDSYKKAVEAWSSVLNADRYKKCKKYTKAADICKCMYKSGYSTGNNWAARAVIMGQYWDFRKHFPK